MTFSFRRGDGPPLVYGHRGARGVLPENTLESFRYLQEIGAQGVEFDVQNAAGGVPVVVHDPQVPAQIARDAQGNWLAQAGPKIRDLTVAELLTYDIGRLNPNHTYGARYADQRPRDGARIPTLAQVLDWAVDAPGMILNIEIKSYATRDDLGDPPAQLVESVLQALGGLDLHARTVISSFDWRVLSELRHAAPEIARGYLSLAQPGKDATVHEGSPWMDGLSLAAHDGSLPRLFAAQGAQAWCPYFKDVTLDDVAQAQALGLAVNVWTVNNPDDMRAMIALGVDGIITDRPDLLQTVVAQSAASPA